MRNLNQALAENQINLPVTEKKKILRRILLEERKILAQETKPQDWGARQFFRALELLKVTTHDLKKAEKERRYRVACYFPIRNELDIAYFAHESWLFPYMLSNGELKWFEYGDGKEGYVKNKFGIMQKSEEDCFIYTEDMLPLLCFVPGLAASVDGHRLGYGGGYYDRFLAKMKKKLNSILCLPSENFVFDSLPTNNYDEKVDLVVW